MNCIMDQAKLEKMLMLMKELSDNDQTSVPDLARQMHITPRTIYRYIDTFKDAGFSVNKIAPGVYNLTTLGEKFVDISRLVMFSKEEAFIVSNLISSLSSETHVRKTLARKLSTVYNSTSIAEFVTNKSTGKRVELLNQAMEDRRQVILHDYESGNSHTIRDRLVEPFKFTTNLADVMAYEEASGRVKIFKISRIKSVEVLSDRWKHQYKHKIEDQDAFRMCGPTEIPVKLELSIMAKNLLLEEYPLAAKDIHKTSTGKIILNTKVRNFKGIGRFVIGLAEEIKIVKAPELVQYIKEYMAHVQALTE